MSMPWHSCARPALARKPGTSICRGTWTSFPSGTGPGTGTATAGVEPAIWKLEGVDKPEFAKAVVKQAQSNGRKAGVITLGRGESKEKVQEWLKVGAKIKGIIGFAVGRTIFWQPLVDYRAGKTDRKQAIEKIAQNYVEFVELWLNEGKGTKQ